METLTKKVMLALFAILSITGTSAKADSETEDGYEYIPYYREGVVRIFQQELYDMWAGDIHAGTRFTTHCFSHTIVCDTVINNADGYYMLDKNLIHYSDCPAMDFVCVDHNFTGYEEDKTIYELGGIMRAIEPEGSYDIKDGYVYYPILDFNLTVGDSTQFWGFTDYDSSNSGTFIVVADEQINVRGREYRRLTLQDEQTQYIDYWVEGIGSANSCVMSCSGIVASGGMFFYAPKLLAVYEDGVLIFEYDDFATTNVLSSVSVVTDEQTDSSSSKGIYDLLGRPLPSEPNTGIYISDGNKRLAL